MINQSVHTLDLLYFLGGPVKSLRASVSQLLDYGIEVEDTVAAQLTYADGGKGLFMATNANYKNESVQIGVQLEKADFAIIENVLYRVARTVPARSCVRTRAFRAPSSITAPAMQSSSASSTRRWKTVRTITSMCATPK